MSLPLPQFFTPRWFAGIPNFLGGWQNTARSSLTLPPNAILPGISIFNQLSAPGNQPTNLPPDAQLHSVWSPNGGFYTPSPPLQPNQRLVPFQLCTCVDHNPATLRGHTQGVAYYVITDTPPTEPRIPNIDWEPPKSDDPWSGLEWDETPPPDKSKIVTTIISIISSAITLGFV